MRPLAALIALLGLGLSLPANAASLDPAFLRHVVEDAARRNLPDTVVEVECHSIMVRSAVDIPADAIVQLRVRGDGDEDWLGQATLEGILTVNGDRRDPIRITADIVAWVEVPVVREPVARGERVRDEHLSVARREADTLPNGTLRQVARIVGRQAKRDLGLNQLVRGADLDVAVDAERNRPVTLVVGSGALRVTVAGVLKQDGRLGELVAVYAPSTKSVVHGILRSSDVVEVPLASASATTSALQR